MERYSKKCIKKYLKIYNLILKSTEEDDDYGLVGDLKLSLKIDSKKRDASRFNKSNRINIGKLRYSVSDDYNGESVLHIERIYINSNHKPNTSIKLTKVLLLHLLALYSEDIYSITLVSTPNDLSKKGTEFCLACFYQELGFEPVNFESKEMIKKCSIYLDKNDKNEKEMCILCRCQRYSKTKNIEILPNVELLQIDMKAMLPRLQKLLKEANHEINQKCYRDYVLKKKIYNINMPFCEYCKMEFDNKSNVNKHQKNF